MNLNDFIFSKYEAEHKDYWFDVKSGSESEKYLTKKIHGTVYGLHIESRLLER